MGLKGVLASATGIVALTVLVAFFLSLLNSPQSGVLVDDIARSYSEVKNSPKCLSCRKRLIRLLQTQSERSMKSTDWSLTEVEVGKYLAIAPDDTEMGQFLVRVQKQRYK